MDSSRLRIPQHKIDELGGWSRPKQDVLQMVTSECALCSAPLLKTSRGVWIDDGGTNGEYCFHVDLPGMKSERSHIARCDLPQSTDRESIEAWLDDA